MTTARKYIVGVEMSLGHLVEAVIHVVEREVCHSRTSVTIYQAERLETAARLIRETILANSPTPE